MVKECKRIKEAKKIVSSSYEEYLKKVLMFVNGEINEDDFKKAKEDLKTHKEEVKNLKKEEGCKDFDPSLDFAYEVTLERVQEVLTPYLEKLKELRKDGETKINDLKDQIINIRLRKNITRKEKKELILPLLEEINKARVIQKENKEKVKEFVEKASFVGKKFGKVYRDYIKSVAHHEKELAKQKCKANLLEEKKAYKEHKKQINKDEIRFVRAEHYSKVKEHQNTYNDDIAKAKGEIHSSYLSLYSLRREIKNNKLTPKDKLGFKWENYKYKFKVSEFLKRNLLYIVIIVFFIVCSVIAQVQGNPLLTLRTLETIGIQSSTKIFFSLGVAGLILLGGTDLSVGRMTGMAATFSCLIMSQLVYETNIGVIDMTIPQALAIVLGIFVCVFSTTLFSALAGFFTSKFKMHPFITTLSTQLLIYGIMMVCFSQVPAFTMDPVIKVGITGEAGWRLPLYAIAAIFLVWFIWNKTKFGKNMYAVGDNKEAAAVSGINVFWVTMGVFIMAGILYGLGGFLEGARIGNANPSTALGTELDAIAACVIGGVSFSGGKGKVSGVVIGTIIFSTLTYCLTYIGLDINYQFIFKGLIILAAVCLDSIKLLKKK